MGNIAHLKNQFLAINKLKKNYDYTWKKNQRIIITFLRKEWSFLWTY